MEPSEEMKAALAVQATIEETITTLGLEPEQAKLIKSRLKFLAGREPVAFQQIPYLKLYVLGLQAAHPELNLYTFIGPTGRYDEAYRSPYSAAIELDQQFESFIAALMQARQFPYSATCLISDGVHPSFVEIRIDAEGKMTAIILDAGHDFRTCTDAVIPILLKYDCDIHIAISPIKKDDYPDEVQPIQSDWTSCEWFAMQFLDAAISNPIDLPSLQGDTAQDQAFFRKYFAYGNIAAIEEQLRERRIDKDYASKIHLFSFAKLPRPFLYGVQSVKFLKRYRDEDWYKKIVSHFIKARRDDPDQILKNFYLRENYRDKHEDSKPALMNALSYGAHWFHQNRSLLYWLVFEPNLYLKMRQKLDQGALDATASHDQKRRPSG